MIQVVYLALHASSLLPYKVLGKVSLKSSEMMTSVAVVHPDKNRNSKFLPRT